MFIGRFSGSKPFSPQNTIEPKDLVITILDVNDNAPIISSNTQFVLDISENDAGPKTLLVGYHSFL